MGRLLLDRNYSTRLAVAAAIDCWIDRRGSVPPAVAAGGAASHHRRSAASSALAASVAAMKCHLTGIPASVPVAAGQYAR